jgi:acetolactate synthase-1/2/3 large subunit
MSEQGRTAVTNSRWSDHPADEWSDAIVASMKLGGIDHIYFVSGTEIIFYQEAIAKAQERGWPAPQLVTVTHESVALNAALGTAMVTGRPSAIAVHVDVGTLNTGAAIHSAWKGNYPVLITAGTAPRAYPGSMPGARDSAVQWVQEPRDQGEILRQYTKMDHRMEYQDNPGLMVSRLLQVARSEPKGPVYMTVPLEIARLKLPGKVQFPTADQLGIARPVWPDPADARKVAQWLIKAENPLIIVGHSGRNPDSVAELVKLAELLAVPVMNSNRANRLNFPASHPLFGTGPKQTEADVIVVLEAMMPFIPPKLMPRRDAKIAWINIDPVQSHYKTMEFDADLWIPATAAGAASAIHDAATKELTKSDLSRIERRRGELADRKRAMMRDAEERMLKTGKRKLIHPQWVGYQLGKMIEKDAIVVNDGSLRLFGGRDVPGTYFKSGGSSGGFGSGAAFGAKMGRPDQDVVLTSGDGYFMFGSPLAALWAAQHHKAPFLSVVMVNKSYSTGTTNLVRNYPDGVAVSAGNFDGGLFDPPPDFAKLAEAANCCGLNVSDPEKVGPTLKEAMKQVRNGTPAVVAVQLPTLPEEMQMRPKEQRSEREVPA